MDSHKRVSRSLAALMLVVALMFPAAVQFVHMFEGHEHITCDNETTHIHASIEKCHICSFHFVSFNYDVVQYPDLKKSANYTSVKDDFTCLQLHAFVITNTQLRAPPIFS